MQYKTVARVYNNFTDKFGIPRQSGLNEVMSRIVFEGEFKNPDYIKGLEGFSHLWLIWEFSNSHETDSPTVRPPRLGGNQKMGVFATRSPYRPNPIGLTLVKLLDIKDTPQGKELLVLGADIMDGTPIVDIKPFIEYADTPVDPVSGFAKEAPKRLKVDYKCDLTGLDQNYIKELTSVLKLDPRPAYHDDPTRRYGLTFGDKNVIFTVLEDSLTVHEITKIKN